MLIKLIIDVFSYFFHLKKKKIFIEKVIKINIYWYVFYFIKKLIHFKTFFVKIDDNNIPKIIFIGIYSILI